MSIEVPLEQLQGVVEEVAADLLAEGGLLAPPVDAFALADRLGLAVARDGWGASRARLVRLAGGGGAPRPAILVADDPRPERRQWAVAHEIGENAAHRVFAALGLDPHHAPTGARETIANHLAGSLLLPREWLVDAGAACDWDLTELKSAFVTASHELLARRMLEMPPPVIVTLVDQGRPVWRRSNVLPRAPRLSDAELAAWRTAHQRTAAVACAPEQLPPGVADVRAWAIHEPHWRREIVRTQLEELW